MSILANKQGILAILQHALDLPQLQFSDIQEFRQNLASGFEQYSTMLNALYLGIQAATPGMAFLAGYQNAIRCLDPNCPNDELAAFCVSERGVKKPWDMSTCISVSDDVYYLNGQKGYVMLLPDDLDRMYVVAKNDDDALCCLYLSINAAGVSTTEVLGAPFVEDIPHSGVCFDNVIISPEQVFDMDGHQQANKPFRYWEDMHVAVAMLGWILRELVENKQGEDDRSLSEVDDIVQLICQLVATFSGQSDYYSIDGITLLDQSHELMDRYSQHLPEDQKKLWMKDRLLLQMGQKIRHLVKAKISN